MDHDLVSSLIEENEQLQAENQHLRALLLRLSEAVVATLTPVRREGLAELARAESGS